MLRQFAVALFALCCFCQFLTAAPWQESAEQSADVPLYDDHVHVLSPELIAHWKAAGMPFSREDRAYSDPLHILESQSLDGAFLVSMAHVYTGSSLAANQEIRDNEQEWVQRENDFVAQCVQQDSTRLVGFFSVNPLRDYSLGEMNRCREIDGLFGLKLHLPACEVDLLDPEHVEKIKQAMAWAVEHRMPVLVHIMTVGESGAREKARVFWNDVMKSNADVGLIVAHLGGAGGYNDLSRAVLEEYEAACQSNARLRVGDTRFALSGAILL
ncbi:MAG: amidohydrolase family protein [Pirellulaceae bacterium]